MNPPDVQTSNHHQPLGPFSIGLTSLIVTIWGATAVTNQFAMDVLPPIYVGGIRFLLAAIFMIGWCLVTRDSLILIGKQWWVAFVLGLLLFLQIGTFNLGIERSNSSHATILVNSFILWVAAYECLISKAIRLHWWQGLGLLLSGGGCCFLLLAAENPASASPLSLDTPTLTGDLILALIGFILALKILYTKYAVQHVKPGPLILWHDVFGTVLFFVCSGLTETALLSEITMPAIWALLFGGIVISGFCFAANAWLLKRHGASQVSVFSFLTPICGVALGVFLRGDQLSIWLVLAGVFVATGIYLVNYTPAPQIQIDT